MQKSAISWTTETWNPVAGCSKVSDGCKFCYAMTLSEKYGWTTKPWTLQNEAENVVMKPHKLHEPYKLKESSRVFVNSMSDLHHRTFPDWYRAAVWIVMLDLPQHVFQVLTKRSEALPGWEERFVAALQTPEFDEFRQTVKDKRVKAALYKEWSTPWADHIWQGVSVEDARVLHRLDDLRASGAKVKFVSAEPLLGAWGAEADVTGLDWIIVGGESGAHMKEGSDRWMQQEWAREIRDLCVVAGVAYFYKQDSGYKTELRPWLVEEDGSKWRWHQFPGELTPPVPLDDKGNPLDPDPTPTLSQFAGYEDWSPPDTDWGSEPREAVIVDEAPDWQMGYVSLERFADRRLPYEPPPPFTPDAIGYSAFTPGDPIWIGPLTTGAPPTPGVFRGWETERPDWALVTLHTPTGDMRVGVHGSVLNAGRPPEQARDAAPFAVDDVVLHVGTQQRAVIRKLDDRAAYVQVYGPEGLIVVPNPDGSPVLAEWLLRHLRKVEESWWVDEDGAVFRDDHPASNDVFFFCRGPFNSEAEARASIQQTWVQAASSEAADRLLAQRAQTPPETIPAPFGDGERLVVQHDTNGYKLDTFAVYASFEAGTHLYFVRMIKRDLTTFAVMTDGSAEFAVSPAVLHAIPQPGDTFRFADKWGDGPVEVTEYRCEPSHPDNSPGNWSFRVEGEDQTWKPLGNHDMRARLDRATHPDPERAVPLPPPAGEQHTITIHTAQMSITDPDMLDITVKSAKTPEGKALAPTWDMVLNLTPDRYTPVYHKLMRDRFQANPRPFLNLLRRDRVVLKCYCRAGEFCHRHLAVDVLKAIAEQQGIRVVDGGEVIPPPRKQMQMSLFEMEPAIG